MVEMPKHIEGVGVSLTGAGSGGGAMRIFAMAIFLVALANPAWAELALFPAIDGLPWML